MSAVVASLSTNTQVWISGTFGEHATELSPFLERLRQAWLARVEQVTGQPIPVFEVKETDVKKIRFRDPSIPITDPVNPLLAENFELHEGMEQSMIDALTTFVPLLRSSDREALEVTRTLVDADSSPSAWFPTFIRVCRGFGLFVVYISCTVENWPDRIFLPVSISKVADLPDENKERLLEQSAFPMEAEAALVESLPKRFEELNHSAEVELCYWRTDEGMVIDPYQRLICVSQLCQEEGVALVAEETMCQGIEIISVKMRCFYL